MVGVLYLLAKCFTVLSTAAFLLATAGLISAIGALPNPVQVRVRQAMFPTISLRMMLIATATSGILIWRYGFHNAAAWSAFALSSTVLFITFTVNVPVSKEILTWSPDAPPRNWRWHIARWNFGDELRLVLSLAALLCVEFS